LLDLLLLLPFSLLLDLLLLLPFPLFELSSTSITGDEVMSTLIGDTVGLVLGDATGASLSITGTGVGSAVTIVGDVDVSVTGDSVPVTGAGVGSAVTIVGDVDVSVTGDSVPVTGAGVGSAVTMVGDVLGDATGGSVSFTGLLLGDSDGASLTAARGQNSPKGLVNWLNTNHPKLFPTS